MKLNAFAILLLGVLSLSVGCEDRPSASSPVAPSDTTPRATAPAARDTVATTQPAAAPVEDQANSSVADIGAGARADDWHAPADRSAFDLNFHLTDQDDNEVNLNDLVGKPMAVTFFFTRCPNPEMCPVIISRLAQLESRVRKEGMADKVRLVAISYDPTHDAPSVMKAYGSQRGMKFDSSIMLRPKADEYLDLLREMEVNIVVQPNGTIGHFIEMILIDNQGRYVRDYRGDIWSNDAVFSDLERLVSEKQEPEQSVESSPTTQPG